MRKNVLTLFGLIMVASGISVTAQQLPNNSFESWKDACGNTEAIKQGTFSVGGMRQRPGVEPTDWNGSSVNQNVLADKTEILITKVAGKTGNAVQAENKFVGVSTIGSNAPGYITLGTPWVNASMAIDDCDGGTYGGVAFTNKPDAITGFFKRTDETGEKSHIIAYLWNGEFSSKVGAIKDPNTDKADVDRAIFAKASAGTITGNGKLVASCDYEFTTTNKEWQEITVPLTYVKDAGAPEKMNVILSAADYWTRANLKAGTTLQMDDVKFVYYSKLDGLKVNGQAVEGFNADTYSYEINSTELPTADQVETTVKGQSATAKVAVDEDAYTVTVTVSNVAADADGKAEHVYTLQYDKTTSGVSEAEVAEAKMYGTSEAVVVNNFSGVVNVYTVDGRLVKSATESGLYIVRAGNTVAKVVVK